jgi:hypothetical protein
MRFTLEIEPGEQPPRGWLEESGRPRVTFVGIVELLAALDRALAAADSTAGESRG